MTDSINLNDTKKPPIKGIGPHLNNQKNCNFNPKNIQEEEPEEPEEPEDIKITIEYQAKTDFFELPNIKEKKKKQQINEGHTNKDSASFPKKKKKLI